MDRIAHQLAVATAIVFLISLVFPVVAGFVHDRDAWPKWWGVLDVAIAFGLATLVLMVLGVTRGKSGKRGDAASFRAYRILIHAIFALMLVFFLAGDRIEWSNCLLGFAWRYWLLLYFLPAWFTAFLRTSQSPHL
jgi:hypothetical protein